MLVVNLFGEPGVGKSVTAAGLFYDLSVNNYRAEIVSEVVKGYAWETQYDKDGNQIVHPIFSQQIFILGKQNRWLQRLLDKREIAIMECPLIMTSIYAPENYLPSFESLVIEQMDRYDNYNIVLERNHKFDNQGRIHNEEQSLEIRQKMLDFLDKHHIKYDRFKTHPEVHKEISQKVMQIVSQKRGLDNK